jgi:aspartate aminotransferase/aminotransferase
MDWTRILSERTRRVEYSGIRRFFELGGRLTDPCDLSIGMPDYDAPEAVKQAAVEAIRSGQNRYTPSAGLPALRSRLTADVRRESGAESEVLVTSGVSGGLTLALLACLDPGDEVIFLDPYFVSYLQLATMVGGRAVPVETYPDFRFRRERVEAAVTPRTKALIINSPGNPTGRVMSTEEVSAAADLCRRHNLLLISDEIYDRLCYDGANPSPLPLAPERTVALRGFGKSYGITGWRMGYAAGPGPFIGEMTKLHQYTYVCAPSMAQSAVVAALDTDTGGFRAAYARKRDLVCRLLSPCYEFERPSGGFYVFPKAPAKFGTGTALCEAAIAANVLVIPGCVFSGRDTHFRISYATSDDKLRLGCETLCRLARE